jgi:hypothetical protein
MKALLSLVSAYANIEIDVEEVIEEMYPDATYKKLVDRTPLMKFQNEQALTPVPAAPGAEIPGVGAPPHDPGPRKPHPKRIDAQESARLRVAMVGVQKALLALKDRRKPAA